MEDAGQPIRGSQMRARLAAVLGILGVALSGAPIQAAQISSAVEQLYTSVSIYPPSATSMTVCYGFVCRRREILEFTQADRKALTQIMTAGRASAVAERAAVQKAVIWFDRRMGPIIALSRQRAGTADAAQHPCADRSRDQGRVGRRSLAARLFATAGCHDGREVGDGRLSGRLWNLSDAFSTADKSAQMRTGFRFAKTL